VTLRLKLFAFIFLVGLILVADLAAQRGAGTQSAQIRNVPGIEFVKVAPGEFMMGCSSNDSACNGDELPRHRVQITKSFEIGKHEVTQAQWMAVMGNNPSGNKGDTLPVETVSKLEIQEFMAKLNAGKDGYHYRLPTEAEWEYAARAGADSPYAGPIDQVAWFAENSDDESHPVGLKKPNAWGLYDTAGNVREWVLDFYSPSFYSVSPMADPAGPQPCAPGAPGFRNAGPGGRGGPGGGPGGPGGGPPRGGPRGANDVSDGAQRIAFQGRGTQQEQIDQLRQQVERLQRELQQLRNDFESVAPPRGGPFGPGGPPPLAPGEIGGGPFTCSGVDANGSPMLIDPLDGLPTGVPVFRGGGWDQSGPYQRVSIRQSYYGPGLKLGDLGFRVAREPAR
jgi:formylglycine-generating enzyme required for sulfatase activity